MTLQTYRIKDYLEYMVDIFEYDHKTNTWKPYLTDDIQLEYVMMNPYYIHQMKILFDILTLVGIEYVRQK